MRWQAPGWGWQLPVRAIDRNHKSLVMPHNGPHVGSSSVGLAAFIPSRWALLWTIFFLGINKILNVFFLMFNSGKWSLLGITGYIWWDHGYGNAAHMYFVGYTVPRSTVLSWVGTKMGRRLKTYGLAYSDSSSVCFASQYITKRWGPFTRGSLHVVSVSGSKNFCTCSLALFSFTLYNSSCTQLNSL